MKSTLLALTLSLATFATAHAQDAKGYHKPAHLLSKAAEVTSVFKASDVEPFTLVGAENPDYRPLTFKRNKIQDGEDITQRRTFQFVLQPGTYQVDFTGTFQSTQGISIVEIGLKIGKKVRAQNLNSIESAFDSFQILTTSQIIKVDEETRLCVVARNTAPGTSVNALHRSVSIIKLN